MADPFADAEDVADRWRPLSAQETLLAEVLCVDASVRVRSRYPGIDDQIKSGALAPDNVLIVVAGMVKRAMLGGAAGDGISQQSQTMGPFSVSQSYSNAMQNLFITAADDELIRGYQPAAKSVDLC